jgi:hypothetical protein
VGVSLTSAAAPAPPKSRREARRAWERRYRRSHAATYRAKRRRNAQTQKRRALEMLGGAICRRCGCTDIRILEVNHRQGGGRKEIVLNGGGNRMHLNILTGRRSVGDLEVLCRPCNAVDYIERKFPELVSKLHVVWVGENLADKTV